MKNDIYRARVDAYMQVCIKNCILEKSVKKRPFLDAHLDGAVRVLTIVSHEHLSLEEAIGMIKKAMLDQIQSMKDIKSQYVFDREKQVVAGMQCSLVALMGDF